VEGGALTDWRVRCERCAWVYDAPDEAEARNLESIHQRDHERKNIDVRVRVYMLPLWRRFFDFEPHGLISQMRGAGYWRAGCGQCEWRVDFTHRDRAEAAARQHNRQKHYRANVATVYVPTWWRRFWDHFWDHE
jgi:hypothetical protein